MEMADQVGHDFVGRFVHGILSSLLLASLFL